MESFVSRRPIGAVSAAILVAFAVFACSTSPVAPTCDPAKCATGNVCIAEGSENKCRRPCSSHGDCPTNYKCQIGSSKSYCVADTLQITAKDTGQWGSPCNSQDGIENAACDGDQKFKCFAKSPTDADAFCTRYDCAQDTDCRSGWYCGAVRSSPNAESSTISWGTDSRLCLPQTFCAPCASDLDCSQKTGPTYCVAGTDGAKFCATECGDDTGCDKWADCKAAPSGKNVCTPRAGVCKGDGKYCAPCRSDGDCKAGGGACLQANQGTNEKFCSGLSASDCTKNSQGQVTHSECPTPEITPTPYFDCAARKNQGDAPFNACFPLVKFGTDTDAYTMGCWTRNYYVWPPPKDGGTDAGDSGVGDSGAVDAAPDVTIVDASVADALDPVLDAAAD